MLDFKKSLDLCFEPQPTPAKAKQNPQNTQTLAWIEIALSTTPNLVPQQNEFLTTYQRLKSTEERFTFLTTPDALGATALESITEQVAIFLKNPGTYHKKKQIKEILENEVKNKSFSVIYRSSTPQHKCLVDIYSNIVSLLSMNSYAQAHRLFVDPSKNITKFYQEFSQSNAHDNNYRNFGLHGTSGSLSLLDASLYESAMFFWWNNIGNIHTDYTNHFESLLKLMRLKKHSKKYNEAWKIINDLIEMCDEFGSCMHQIFIAPTVVDDLVWVSTPFGKKRSTNQSTFKLLEDVLQNPSGFSHEHWKKLSIFDDFQARIYVADARFYNPNFVKTDFYYANPLNKDRFKKYKLLRKRLSQMLLENYLKTYKRTRNKEAAQPIEALIKTSINDRSNHNGLKQKLKPLHKAHVLKLGKKFSSTVDQSFLSIQRFFKYYKIQSKNSSLKKLAMHYLYTAYQKLNALNSTNTYARFKIFQTLAWQLEKLLHN